MNYYIINLIEVATSQLTVCNIYSPQWQRNSTRGVVPFPSSPTPSLLRCNDFDNSCTLCNDAWLCAHRMAMLATRTLTKGFIVEPEYSTVVSAVSNYSSTKWFGWIIVEVVSRVATHEFSPHCNILPSLTSNYNISGRHSFTKRKRRRKLVFRL